MNAPVVRDFLFVALLLFAAVTDIRRREIDNWVCVAILAASFVGGKASLLGAVTTALPYFIPLCVKSDAMGGGDVKFMFACGAFLGIGGGALQSGIALSLVLLFSLVIAIRNGFSQMRKNAVPLAPFFCLGGIVALIYTTSTPHA